jgi:hypothetical protein
VSSIVDTGMNFDSLKHKALTIWLFSSWIVTTTPSVLIKRYYATDNTLMSVRASGTGWLQANLFFGISCLLCIEGKIIWEWRSRDTSVSIVTRLRAGRPRPDSRQGQGYFPFGTASRPALEPIQWVPGSFPPRVKLQRRETDHSPTFSAEVNAWSFTTIL